MQRREAVQRAMRGHAISQRRACVLVGVDPKTVRRERSPDNPEIREEMHKIAEKRGMSRPMLNFGEDDCLVSDYATFAG